MQTTNSEQPSKNNFEPCSACLSSNFGQYEHTFTKGCLYHGRKQEFELFMDSEPVDKQIGETIMYLLQMGKYSDKPDIYIAKTKQAIKTLIANSNRLAIEEYIKPYLDYCQELNGLPFCKNCGLEAQDKSREKK